MKIYLLDNNPVICKTWNLYFEGEREVEIECDDFKHFMDTTDVECVVSPANSFGIMDGGYDLAISEWFEWKQQDLVKDYIQKHYYGEQPVGTSFIIDTDVKGIKLIHTPTMRTPSPIKEPLIVYQCMRTTLMVALDNNIKSIIIPAFGGLCGGLSPQVICEMMWKGYRQIFLQAED